MAIVLHLRSRMRPGAAPDSSSGRGSISRTTKIRQVMTLSPHTIGSDQKLTLAHKMMRDYHLRHLPVLRSGELVGVLSERDLFFLESVAGVDVEIDAVSEAMTADVYKAHPEDYVRDVACIMALRRYGCAVVMEGRRLLGIFTVTDALRYLAEALA